LGAVGAYVSALAVVGFVSDLLPFRPALPILFAVAGAVILYEAWVFWARARRSQPARPRIPLPTIASRPPRSWDEARRRFIRVYAAELLALAALGAGVGFGFGSPTAAVWLAVAFSLVSVAWFVVVYRIGRRQWANRRRP
jgi:hypothetical protein